MEIMTMGKVTVSARIENLQDTYEAEKGLFPAGDVRSVEVADALVDTGATMLSIPRRLIAQLGLTRRRTRTARTAAGVVSFGIYGAVRLTVQGATASWRRPRYPTNAPFLSAKFRWKAWISWSIRLANALSAIPITAASR